ncbi:MAG: MOSC domain-containing protein [Pyrinomonadaceae bacterium]|nr:MOSC domain-containing protein [Pyrinomonadaceae bacterium]
MHISEINIYPIKSLAGISVEAAMVEERGLRYDRRWMLTTPDGMFFTQREFPKMATLSVWIEEDGGGLGVAADRFGDVFVPMDSDSDKRQMVTIWGSVCEAEVYGAALNEWFSDVLGTECQLVKMPDDSRRNVSELFNSGDDVVSFADGYPQLVIGEASLEDLNGRLRQAGMLAAPVPMNRFRPNVVVAGSDPYAEDDWKRIRIGGAEFRSSKPCARCVMTTIDQAKGEFDGKDPLKTLATYRMAKDVMPERVADLGLTETAVLFGQNLIGESVGSSICVGDEIEVIDSY